MLTGEKVSRRFIIGNMNVYHSLGFYLERKIWYILVFLPIAMFDTKLLHLLAKQWVIFPVMPSDRRSRRDPFNQTICSEKDEVYYCATVCFYCH